ncbi:MAG: DUF1326 domain-containing protein [Alphaproteobacteria bacterium]|nr:DUF1326 domain-containing protein [Alphaproteobacteria bacterium]
MTPWEIEAEEFVSCNCAYGCPCQFNALPTHGSCQAVAGFQIGRGRFGETVLDGLRAAGILSWPGAIHEGRGKALIVIDHRADEAQRAALLAVLSGEETEPGATMWNVFASTMDEVFDPRFTDIELEVDVDARRGRLRVEGLIDSSGEPIRNPVTGAEHRARIDLPAGFEYGLAEMGSATSRTMGPIAFSFEDSYAQFARIHLNNTGVVR